MNSRQKNVIILLLVLLLAPFYTTKATAAPTSVTSFATQYVGSPYKFGGSTPAGFDCSGFMRFVFAEFGVKLPHSSEQQFYVGTPVTKEQLVPGDIVFFENTYKPGISHSGIYLGNNKFVSAKNERLGVAVADLFGTPYWGEKYVGAKRVLQGGGADPKPSFSDLSDKHLAYAAILELSQKGIITGFHDSTFQPDGLVTRGQAAAMLNRVLQFTPTKDVQFVDVGKTHQFAKDIAAMNEKGIVMGYHDGRFGLNEHLTRTQLAAIIDRAFKLSEKYSVETASYQDVPSTYRGAREIQALKLVDKTGIFQTTTFDITKQVTRAEFAAAVYSALP